MPKQQTHIRVVREWCQSLGVLTAISISREEAEMKLAAYTPMLMRDFPDAAFTAASLNDVARQCTEGFPIYPVLAARLGKWWREHRPAPPALPPPPPIRQRDEPTPEEVEHVTRVAAETIAALRSSAQPVEDRRPPQPRFLTPAQLDQLNPLPDGRKRTDAHREATVSPRDTAAAIDPDTAAAMAPADAVAGDP